MSQLLDILRRFAFFGNEYIILIVSFAVFFIVFLISVVVARYALGAREIKERAYQPSVAAGLEADLDRRLPRNIGMGAISSAFSKAAARFAPGANAKSSSVIRNDLIQAGFHDPAALAWYYFSRVLAAIALPAIGLPILVSFGLAQSTMKTFAFLALLALVGMIFPSLYIMRRKRKLAAEYRDGFPEFMDLIVVCVEAGISLSAAINRVTNELAKTHKNLALNLHIMTLEMRAGRTLAEGFESLSHRVALDEVRMLGSLLQQSEDLGTSLAEALRTFSKEMREKRFFKAEEKAYALPAKMVIPLGLFIFPTMLIVIMLPLVIRIAQAFFS